MAIEKLTLRKGSGVRVVTLDGSRVTVKVGTARSTFTGYLNAIMARSRRDRMVEELKAEGWTLEAAKARKKKFRTLEWSEVKTTGAKKPLDPPPPSKGVAAWPEGYAEFLKRFGSGILEDLIVLPPAQVKKRTATWKKGTAPVSARLWPNIGDLVDDASKVVVIAASQNGDVIGFAKPDALLLFPRGSNRVIAAGTTFLEALGTWCFSDEIGEPRATKKARFVAL